MMPDHPEPMPTGPAQNYLGRDERFREVCMQEAARERAGEGEQVDQVGPKTTAKEDGC
jgi:hypothetical protein